MSQQVFDAWGNRKSSDAGARRSLYSYNHVSSGGGVSNFQLAGAINCSALTTGALTAGRLYGVPFCAPRGGTISQMAISVSSSGSGSSTYVGIYKATSLTNLYPSALVVDCGTISTASTGTKTYTTGLPISFDVDTLYWFACLCNTTAPTLRSLALNGAYPIFGIDSGFGTAQGAGIYVAQTYGALPATFPASGTVITATPIPAIGCTWSA